MKLFLVTFLIWFSIWFFFQLCVDGFQLSRSSNPNPVVLNHTFERFDASNNQRVVEFNLTIHKICLPFAVVDNELFNTDIQYTPVMPDGVLYLNSQDLERKTPSNSVHSDCSNSNTDLIIDPRCCAKLVYGVDGYFPGPTLHVEQDDLVIVHVHNKIFQKRVFPGTNDSLDIEMEETSLHFHGVLLSEYQGHLGNFYDGVPNVTQHGISPNENFSYYIDLRQTSQTGTYWYHSHVGFQRAQGVFGMFIISPKNLTRQTCRDISGFSVCHENALLLQDWFWTPYGILFHDFKHFDHQVMRFQSVLCNGKWKYPCVDLCNELNSYCIELANKSVVSDICKSLSPLTCSDWNDGILHSTMQNVLLCKNDENNHYSTFLVGYPENVLFRIVGAQLHWAMELYFEHHSMHVVSIDGLSVQPYVTDSILISPGETYDVIISTRNNTDCPDSVCWIKIVQPTLKRPTSSTPVYNIAKMIYASPDQSQSVPLDNVDNNNNNYINNNNNNYINEPNYIQAKRSVIDVNLSPFVTNTELTELKSPTAFFEFNVTAFHPHSSHQKDDIDHTHKYLFNGIAFQFPLSPLLLGGMPLNSTQIIAFEYGISK